MIVPDHATCVFVVPIAASFGSPGQKSAMEDSVPLVHMHGRRDLGVGYLREAASYRSSGYQIIQTHRRNGMTGCKPG